MGAKNFQKKGGRKAKAFSSNHDPFFSNESRKRRKVDDQIDDGEIDSDGEEDGFFAGDVGAEGEAREADVEDETEGEARKRIAEEHLKRLRDIARRKEEEREEEGEGSGEDDDDNDDDVERGGGKDSLISQRLIKEQMEESGRVRRAFASRVQQQGTSGEFQLLVKHRHSVTAVALSEDDKKGFSASKDGIIMHWDVDSGKSEKYQWPSDEVLKSHGAKDPQGRAQKHSKHILALAVSSDGRYLATGGLDRHVHLWDTRTREHVQSFPGHRGPVSCLAFRQGTSELFSGSFDRTVKIWNAEDRTYMNTLFGHQSEILTIDCLRKERVLTAGRDRSMQLFKVHEESRLVFRAPASSLESSCFVTNDEFLSGSDDGSIELWSVMRKKPVYIARNAHAVLSKEVESEPKDNGTIPNGDLENGHHNPESYHCSSASSWVGAVTVCRNSDLAASGAGNGSVRLWAVESEAKDMKPVYDVPLVGYVNSLAFAKSAEFLVAGVGQFSLKSLAWEGGDGPQELETAFQFIG
ncbi:U3 snoRNP-associated protein-like EMB2271 [Senna tora]|uniref:U3 snoRNP-associated protein-like EMB2271 n=1 Tax=Senna tora TaxID=362788 RepID=A0A835CJM7_9FABA|nr:U3 snoRNP-associated protein-like EMB2271 [Senna tora]